MRHVLFLMLTNPYRTLFDSLGIVVANITGLLIQVYIYFLFISLHQFTELFHEVLTSVYMFISLFFFIRDVCIDITASQVPNLNVEHEKSIKRFVSLRCVLVE